MVFSIVKIASNAMNRGADVDRSKSQLEVDVEEANDALKNLV